MDFKPTDAVNEQLSRHEQHVLTVSDKNSEILENALTVEAHLSINGHAELTSLITDMKSSSLKLIASNQIPYENYSEQPVLDSTSLPKGYSLSDGYATEWVGLGGTTDEGGLSPQMRFVQYDAHRYNGPGVPHSQSYTRFHSSQAEIRWVKDEFISMPEALISFSEDFRAITIHNSEDGVKVLHLDKEMDDEQTAAFADAMSSVMVPLHNAVVSAKL